jgi:hypothetical protein
MTKERKLLPEKALAELERVFVHAGGQLAPGYRLGDD